MNKWFLALSLPMFNEQEIEKIEALISKCATRLEFSSKQTIADFKEDLSSVYFVLSGETSHFISDGTNEKLLYRMTPGWIFGNLSPEGNNSEHIIARTVTDTVVYEISRKDYSDLMHNNAEFASHVIACIYKLNRYFISEIDNLAFNSCKTRLMRVYCSQVDTQNVTDDKLWYQVSAKFTHSDLAAIVGSARVTISKLINELCDDGFLRIVNRKVQINVAEYEKFLSEGVR